MKRGNENSICFKLGRKIMVQIHGPHCVYVVALVVCGFLAYFGYRVFSLLYALVSPWLTRLLNG